MDDEVIRFTDFLEVEPPEPHSIRARLSELVRDGFLRTDVSFPRNYWITEV